MASLAAFSNGIAEPGKKRKGKVRHELEQSASRAKFSRTGDQGAEAEEEGCGDSFDEACTIHPRREIRTPSPPAADAWDATKPGVCGDRAALIVRLPAWKASLSARPSVNRRLASEQTEGSLLPASMDASLSATYEMNMDRAMNAEGDSSTHEEQVVTEGVYDLKPRSALAFRNGVIDRAILDGFPHSGLRSYVASQDCGRGSEAQMDRLQLVERLAEASVQLEEGPQSLYLAVAMLDACLSENRRRGRRMDCVQREVLGLTCLYLACNQFATVQRTPDQFCTAARLAEGTVKGCMVSCQVAVVESLLGFSSRLATLPDHHLWSLMQPTLERTQVEYMARFVLQLAGSAFAQQHFTDDVLAAAMRPLGPFSPGPDGEVPDPAQILERFLCTRGAVDAEELSGGSEPLEMASSPTSVLYEMRPHRLHSTHVGHKPCGPGNDPLGYLSMRKLLVCR